MGLSDLRWAVVSVVVVPERQLFVLHTGFSSSSVWVYVTGGGEWVSGWRGRCGAVYIFSLACSVWRRDRLWYFK